MPSDNSSQSTRRRWLKGTAALGTGVLVAGCGGSGDGTEPGTGTSGDGTSQDTPNTTSPTPPQSVDKYFTHPAWYGLTDSNFNIFGETFNLWLGAAEIFERLAYMSRQDHKPYPQALKSYEVGDKAMTMNLREGLSWHSGQSFTAQDVANHIRLLRLFGPPYAGFESDKGVEVVDEHTLKWHFKSGTNTNMAYYSMLELNYYHVATHPELHKEFIERERDATTDEARSSIRNDLAQFVISSEDAVETIGNGPLQMVKANQQELILEPYPDSPSL